MNLLIKSSAAFAAIAVVCSAYGQFTPVTSPGALGGNDTINWAQFGADGTSVASGVHGTTTGGIGFSVESVHDTGVVPDGGAFERLSTGNGWTGDFQLGEPLLFHENSYTNDGSSVDSVLHIHFDTAVMGVGLQADTNTLGAETANMGLWTSFPGNSVGFASNTGTSSSTVGTGDTYVGGKDTIADINDIYVVAYMSDNTSSNDGFAVGTVDVLTPVPEPTSFAVLGLGVVALFRRRGRSRN